MEPIHYSGCYFRFDVADVFNINIQLSTSADFDSEILWDCNLKGLWYDKNERETLSLTTIWSMHNKGDYFQQTIFRHNRSIHPHISYTAWFQDMLAINKINSSLIENIYSTSALDWLSMGYAMSAVATRFWQQQVSNEKAIFIETEQRFKALLNS